MDWHPCTFENFSAPTSKLGILDPLNSCFWIFHDQGWWLREIAPLCYCPQSFGTGFSQSHSPSIDTFRKPNVWFLFYIFAHRLIVPYISPLPFIFIRAVTTTCAFIIDHAKQNFNKMFYVNKKWLDFDLLNSSCTLSVEDWCATVATAGNWFSSCSDWNTDVEYQARNITTSCFFPYQSVTL